MSWITAIWSGTAAICLTLAGVHFLVWVKSRDSWASLLFSISATSAAICAGFELALMHSQTPAQFGEMLRWFHVPLAVLVVSLIWFVRQYLQSGRLWLLWLFCGLRVVTLTLTFSLDPNLNFREITGLHSISAWGETIVSPIGVKNPWTNITHASGLVLIVFVVDAAMAAWRKGQRRQALVVAGTFGLAVVVALTFSELLDRGGAPIPFTMSLAFLVIVLGMAYELSVDMLNANRLARELRENQEHMTLATKAADLGVWSYDVRRNEIWVSDTIRARIGLGKSERLTMERFHQTLHPDDRDEVRRAVDQTLKEGKELQVEYRAFSADGSIRWMAVSGRAEHGPRGEPVRMHGISLEITKHKQAEIAVRQSEELLRTQFMNSPAFIVVIERDYRIVMINRTGTSLPLDEVKGRCCLDLLPPEHRDEARRRIDECFSTGRRQEFEHKLANGIWVRARMVRMGDGSAADRVMILSTDITESKQAAERIRESAEFNERVLASFHSHIAILDRNGMILAVNDAWKEFSLVNGAASSEVGIGVNYLEVCERAGASGDVTAGHAFEGVRSILEGTQDFFDMEYPCSSPAEFRSFLMRVVPLKTSGGGAVVTHTDVTQLRRAELEAQELRSDLAHVSRVSTMGQLSTALAHELNQPLGAILSNAEAAEMLLDADPPSLEQVREILADIRKDDERAGEVIRRMRALLRKREMGMVPLDMGDLVQDVLRLTSGDAALRKVSVRAEVDAGPLPTRGDRVHLQQVLLNLLVNGMEAVAGNPLGKRQVIMRAGRNGTGEIEVAVSDSGPGIPPDQLPRLFEPFFTTKPNGMGMGISIARTIIQAHHGRIWAENKPDGGATFRFTLPIDRRPESR